MTATILCMPSMMEKVLKPSADRLAKTAPRFPKRLKTISFLKRKVLHTDPSTIVYTAENARQTTASAIAALLTAAAVFVVNALPYASYTKRKAVHVFQNRLMSATVVLTSQSARLRSMCTILVRHTRSIWMSSANPDPVLTLRKKNSKR